MKTKTREDRFAAADVVEFAETQFRIAQTGALIKLEDHQRRILRAIFTEPYPSEVVFSAPKKSGKTTVGAVVALFVAVCVAPPGSEVICAANDEEQAQSRVFTDVRYAVEHNPELRRYAKITDHEIRFRFGVTIRAIASDYGSARCERGCAVEVSELRLGPLPVRKRPAARSSAPSPPFAAMGPCSLLLCHTPPYGNRNSGQEGC